METGELQHLIVKRTPIDVNNLIEQKYHDGLSYDYGHCKTIIKSSDILNIHNGDILNIHNDLQPKFSVQLWM